MARQRASACCTVPKTVSQWPANAALSTLGPETKTMPAGTVVVVMVVVVALVETDVPEVLDVLNDVSVMLDEVEVTDVTVDVEVGTSPLTHVQD
jgi:hypothetical protein